MSGSTYTWHVAQEQQPPQSAMISSTPPRRIVSITEIPVSAWILICSPLRIDTISTGMLFTPSARYIQPLHARLISRRQLSAPNNTTGIHAVTPQLMIRTQRRLSHRLK
jgi:hypothetical protein